MTDIQTKDASTQSNSAVPAARATSAALWRRAPELDVYESAGGYLLIVNVPDATPESVDVQVLGTELYVQAEQAASPSDTSGARTTFERRVELPNEVDPNSATAELRDGVLRIEIQKSPAARRVKVPVSSN